MKTNVVYKILFSTHENKDKAWSLRRFEHMLSFVHTNGFIGKLIKHIVSLESKYLTRNIFKNTTFLQIGEELNQNYKPPKLLQIK